MSWQNLVLSFFLRRRLKPALARDLDVAEVRDLASQPMWRPRAPRGWRIRDTADPLAGEWIERDSGVSDRAAGRTLLYLHGGGYFFCSPETHRPITLRLAAEADARTFVPDYRLAPEHRFPAAVEDAVAAYRGIVAAGTPARRMVIAGDSAGGGLALATLLSLRDAGDPLPAGAVLFAPWTDLACTGASLAANEESDVLFHGDGIARAAPLYLGDTPATNPLASPLYADLGGLPPLLIQASDSEVLLDDSTRLAAKAAQAGVQVSFKTWPGLPHVWQLFAPFLPEARAALAEAAAFIRGVVP